MKSILLFGIVFLILVSWPRESIAKVLDTAAFKEKAVTKVAFGSCNRHDEDSNVFDSIYKYRPDLFVWTGDVVYGDYMVFPMYWVSSSMQVVQEKFNYLKQKPSYQNLWVNFPITGVWDDHDFDNNNGGKNFPHKSKVQQLYLDFLDEPASSPRRKQEGLYASYTLGPPGKQIKIILLDTRYFRDDPNTGGDVLGEAQWKSLEADLTNSTAQIHVLVSGIQVIPIDKPLIEKWGNFVSRKRLFETIGRLKVPGVVLISGDVHYAEIFKVDGDIVGTGYPIYEITSSGMTHTWGTQTPLGLCRPIWNTFLHSRYHINGTFYEWFNFGTIEVAWDTNPVTLALQVRNESGNIVSQQKIALPDLKAAPDHVFEWKEPEPESWQVLPLEFYRDALMIGIGIITVFFLVRYCCITRPTQAVQKKPSRSTLLKKAQ